MPAIESHQYSTQIEVVDGDKFTALLQAFCAKHGAECSVMEFFKTDKAAYFEVIYNWSKKA
jgi:hypothetical protein